MPEEISPISGYEQYFITGEKEPCYTYPFGERVTPVEDIPLNIISSYGFRAMKFKYVILELHIHSTPSTEIQIIHMEHILNVLM
ncbi:MAG: hypothetical protein A2804_00315 [Candidatus Pacebacteria bacterium RIFCSPHIGHO2_01_FULL_46_10]|nr:MAG: hypothetical protein A2804_00315 [Candidatus Pacebacteria bacterium RIFCSPHIGHO2_01_FULL_46_10]